ncbi:MAG: protein kinase [Anaeromyxobacteraceae bacterium]|nr:protein kinase [Anaeromyxobacteraceae bacterium]
MRVFGRYQLLAPLASGGMAEVWRARTTGAAGVEKEVALKLLRGEHQASSDFARMLVAEARLAARLSHANVVQVFELVEEGGRHAIAMELVHGHDLGRVVERCREAGVRLGLPRALHVCVEVARALDYAHRASAGGRLLGVVHRDVSPANVLVSFEGEVKLADFGIARATGQAGLTDPGTVKGKLAYMAPEQARGEPVDARADVFALGVICWELCTGRRLLARDSDGATLAAVLDGAPFSPPSAWNEAVPPALDAAVLAALAREPGARTATAGELGAALSAALLGLVRSPEDTDLRALMRRLWPEASTPSEPPAVRGAASGAPPASPAPPPAVTALAPTRTLVPERRAWWRRRPWVAPLLAAAGAVLVARNLDRPAAPRSLPQKEAAVGAPVGAAPTLRSELDEAAARRGEGRVVVSAHPWASLWVDGQPVGETPRELLLPVGRHMLRAAHPTFGEAEVEVEVLPGRRLDWTPALTRP